MKFLVPNYSCLQNPWLGGYRPQIPVLSVLNWICWTPPRTKFLGTPLLCSQFNARSTDDAIISLLLTACTCHRLTIPSQILRSLCVSFLVCDSAFVQISGHVILLYFCRETVPITKQVIHILTCTLDLCFRTNRLHQCALTTKVLSLWLECLQLDHFTNLLQWPHHANHIAAVFACYEAVELLLLFLWPTDCSSTCGMDRYGTSPLCFSFLRMFFCLLGEPQYLIFAMG
jgi:hypothetical protein